MESKPNNQSNERMGKMSNKTIIVVQDLILAYELSEKELLSIVCGITGKPTGMDTGITFNEYGRVQDMISIMDKIIVEQTGKSIIV